MKDLMMTHPLLLKQPARLSKALATLGALAALGALTLLSMSSEVSAQAVATPSTPAASAPAMPAVSAPASAETAAPAKSAASDKPAAAQAPARAASASTSSPHSAVPLFKNDVYGVEVMGAHISGSGYVIDVRYRVLDAAKAAPMLDRKVRPVLINEGNGERFYVPQPPIIGSLRQTSRNNNVIVGKVYFMLFANPDKRIKNGDKLSLLVGDQKFGVLEIGK
jgi:hypothetical protein